MIRQYFEERQGRAISDEDEFSYLLGFHDACEALRSDEVYYEVANAKPTLSRAILRAADYIEGKTP